MLNRDEDRAAKELRKKILSNRKQKLEMRERGHVTAVQPGANAEQDALERALVRTATKGVVKLFNAIHQAQRQHRRAEGDRQKTAEAKENLMDQLEGAARNVSKIEVGSRRRRADDQDALPGMLTHSLSLRPSMSSFVVVVVVCVCIPGREQGVEGQGGWSGRGRRGLGCPSRRVHGPVRQDETQGLGQGGGGRAGARDGDHTRVRGRGRGRDLISDDLQKGFCPSAATGPALPSLSSRLGLQIAEGLRARPYPHPA